MSKFFISNLTVQTNNIRKHNQNNQPQDNLMEIDSLTSSPEDETMIETSSTQTGTN